MPPYIGERKAGAHMRITNVILVAALCVVTAEASGISVVIAHPAARVAPADEYFGRLKLSILGIRNELNDLSVRLTYAPARAQDVMGTARFVEDALRDWADKYPLDPWIPKDLYDLAHLYARIPTAAGSMHAVRLFRWLETRYHDSRYALRAREEMQITRR